MRFKVNDRVKLCKASREEYSQHGVGKVTESRDLTSSGVVTIKWDDDDDPEWHYGSDVRLVSRPKEE